MKGRDWTKVRLGEKPDTAIALELRCSREAVGSARRRLGIPAFGGLVLTQEGVPTRSIYEAEFDAWLHWKGIDHRHEVRVPGLPYIADFEIRGVFIEIVGMVGFRRYENKVAVKRAAYERCNIRTVWLTPTMVGRMFRECPLPLRFRGRQCTSCGIATHQVVRGMCRPCNRRRWGTANARKVSCDTCGVPFEQSAGNPEQRFCSHACYSRSLELSWPSWEAIDARLKSISVCGLAIELGVGPTALYNRLRRRRDRDPSAPAVRDSRKKLSTEDVLEIRRRHAAGESQASLARAFGVGAVAVHQIVHRVSWGQV